MPRLLEHSIKRRFAPFFLSLALLFPSAALAGGIDLDGTPLVTSEGEEVRFSSELFSAPATVLSFTFSGCRSSCPVSDVVMSQIAEKVQAQSLDLALVTVTIDPLNDTPDVLIRHRDKYGFPATQTWRWLTGHPDDIANVLQRLGMTAGPLDDHPSFFLVVGRGGVSAESLLEETATPETIIETAQAMAAGIAH